MAEFSRSYLHSTSQTYFHLIFFTQLVFKMYELKKKPTMRKHSFSQAIHPVPSHIEYVWILIFTAFLKTGPYLVDISKQGEKLKSWAQLLPMLKKDIPGFQQTCPSTINHTEGILKTIIRRQSCISAAWQCQGVEPQTGTPRAPRITDRIRRHSNSKEHMRGCKVFFYHI